MSPAMSPAMAFRNVHIKDSQQLIVSIPSRPKSLKWEPFWSEVDLAERMLVSGMFEDAARMASEMLDRLQSAEVADSWVAQQGKDMTEQVVTYASGNGRGAVIASMAMVLIQALHQMDRHVHLATIIRTKFKGVARVPPQAFLAWVCLQVAALEFTLARAALEEYLEATAAFHASAVEQLAQEGVVELHPSGCAVSPGSGPLMPRSPLASGERVTGATGFGSSNGRKRSGPRKSEIIIDVAEHIPEGVECLTREEYEVLVGIYTREVLSRGFGEPAFAIHWLKDSANLLSQDRRQVLVSQVQGIEASLLGTTKKLPEQNGTNGAQLRGTDEELGSVQQREADSSAGQPSAPDSAVVKCRHGRNHSPMRGQYSWLSWIAAVDVWLKGRCNSATQKARNFAGGQGPLAGFRRYLALALIGGLLTFVAVWKRQSISRLLKRLVGIPRGILTGIVETIREEIDEFRQLAFNVNSNPGASLPRLQGSVRPRSTMGP